MKSRVVFAGGIMTAILAILSASPVSALSLYSDWVSTPRIVHEELPDGDYPRCEQHLTSVRQDMYYGSVPDSIDPQQRCVYQQANFSYVDFVRTYGYYPFSFTERGRAVMSIDDYSKATFTPINESLDAIMEAPHSSTLFRRVSPLTGTSGYNIEIRKEFAKNLRRSLSGDMYEYIGAKELVTGQDGQPARIYGSAVSSNGHWLIYFTESSLSLLNIDTMQSGVIMRGQFATSSYSVGLGGAVSNDGKVIFVNGSYLEARVIMVTQACLEAHMDGLCASRLLGDITSSDDYPISPWGGGASSMGDLRISDDSYSVMYQTNNTHGIHWHQLSYDPIVRVQYLLLGDSFASGQGDTSFDGVDHYLPGTNVYGDYLRGIPRENCHVSDRSYGMLIAKDMGLARGTDMNAIACSGAVVRDILSLDKTSYIDTGYQGQDTEAVMGWNTSMPRLRDVTNTAELQDEARSNYQPGRVQQIELIKKSQPQYATLSVGGNDIGFAGELTSCIINASLSSLDQTCDVATPDGRARKAQEIWGYQDASGTWHGYYEDLKATYKAIMQESPHTKLYVIGYPKFLTDKPIVCTDGLLLTQTERHSINELIDYFNATIRSAAHDAGATYIDITDTLGLDGECGTNKAVTGMGRDAIYWIYTQAMKDKQYTGDAMAAGIDPSSALILGSFRTYYESYGQMLMSPNTAIFNFAEQLMHPNAYGHNLIYNHMKEGLGDDLLASTQCNEIVVCPGGAELGRPDVSSYIPGLTVTHDKIIKNGNGAVSIGYELDKIYHTDEVVKGAKNTIIRVAVKDLESLVGLQIKSGTLHAQLHSDPVDLGGMHVDADGIYVLDAQIAIPSSVPVGWHTLHLMGETETGQLVDIYKKVFVRGPIGDYDDDKMPDDIDRCAFAGPSALGNDSSGIANFCGSDTIEDRKNDVNGRNTVFQGGQSATMINSRGAGNVSDVASLTATQLLGEELDMKRSSNDLYRDPITDSARRPDSTEEGYRSEVAFGSLILLLLPVILIVRRLGKIDRS